MIKGVHDQAACHSCHSVSQQPHHVFTHNSTEKTSTAAGDKLILVCSKSRGLRIAFCEEVQHSMLCVLSNMSAAGDSSGQTLIQNVITKYRWS